MVEQRSAESLDEKTKHRRYTNLEKFGVLADTVSAASSVELGTLVRKITAEAFANQKRQKQVEKWNDLKDRALAKASDLKSRGSEKILVGMATAPNKSGEPEARMYFVFFGNETNPLYITGVPLKIIPKIDRFRQSKGDIEMDNVTEFVSKMHKKN